MNCFILKMMQFIIQIYSLNYILRKKTAHNFIRQQNFRQLSYFWLFGFCFPGVEHTFNVVLLQKHLETSSSYCLAIRYTRYLQVMGLGKVVAQTYTRSWQVKVGSSITHRSKYFPLFPGSSFYGGSVFAHIQVTHITVWHIMKPQKSLMKYSCST